jgi:hypothetical protein
VTPPRSAGPTAKAQPAAAVGNGEHAVSAAPVEEIRLRAYARWEHAGKPAGDGVKFWLEAEQELLHNGKSSTNPEGA